MTLWIKIIKEGWLNVRYIKFCFYKLENILGTVLLVIILSDCVIIPICNTIIKCINGKKYLEILKDKIEESEKKKLWKTK